MGASPSRTSSCSTNVPLSSGEGEEADGVEVARQAGHARTRGSQLPLHLDLIAFEARK
jgi:hypothetical protein